jgi:hypothetical protein
VSASANSTVIVKRQVMDGLCGGSGGRLWRH